MAAEPDFVVEQERGISLAEFFRVLPRVVIGYDHHVEDRRITLWPEGDRSHRIEIELSEERKRELSAIFTLPAITIHLAFFGYTQGGFDAFMEHFNLRYLRGGG
ncbi:MAG: hypothetical protein OEZ06_25775 [Myxococcales bacterium]|nr:hypothetical protein [Myxococcales bacterium]